MIRPRLETSLPERVPGPSAIAVGVRRDVLPVALLDILERVVAGPSGEMLFS